MAPTQTPLSGHNTVAVTASDSEGESGDDVDDYDEDEDDVDGEEVDDDDDDDDESDEDQDEDQDEDEDEEDDDDEDSDDDDEDYDGDDGMDEEDPRYARRSRQQQTEEDAELEKEMALMLTTSLEARKFDARVVSTHLRDSTSMALTAKHVVPTPSSTAAHGADEDETAPAPVPGVAFRLITRNHNQKPLARTLLVPAESEFVAKLQHEEMAKARERDDLKRMVMQAVERTAAEDAEEEERQRRISMGLPVEAPVRPVIQVPRRTAVPTERANWSSGMFMYAFVYVCTCVCFYGHL